MKEFIERIDRFSEPKLGFCFTSYGLYHGNSLRIVIKLLQSKNIIIQDYKALKGPASDGSLLYPSKIKFMFRYGKNVRAKLDEFVNNITSSNHFRTKPKLPLWRVYVPFNELLKLVSVPIFNSYKNNLRVDYEDCITCEICVKECPRNCWIFIDDHVVFNGADCEFCTKCIHNCPTNAIIFNKKMKNKPRLNHRFYKGAIETLNKEN